MGLSDHIRRLFESEVSADLGTLLNAADRNHDGRVNWPEFRVFCQDAGVDSVDRIERWFRDLDANRDGVVDDLDDANDDGVIDADDFKHFSDVHCADDPYGAITVNNDRIRKRLEQDMHDAHKRLHRIEATEKFEPMRNTGLYTYDVPILDLPDELVGTTILQLSDIHFKPNHKSANKMSDLVESMLRKGIRPDFIVATGDYIHNKVTDFDETAVDGLKLFSLFDTPEHPCPRLFVLGNHAFGTDGHKPVPGASDIVRKKMEEAGFEDATNVSRQFIVKGEPINFHGVDDVLFGDPKLPRLAKHRAQTNILLTHSLDALNNRCSGSLDLILSGHLHGGEVMFGGTFDGVDFMMKGGYYKNFHEHKRGWKPLTRRTMSYIQPGFSSNVPFRFGVEKEGATLLRLVKG
jgi:predicted MPP superfamily phosphohydrolase